jgi:hypothetical protein
MGSSHSKLECLIKPGQAGKTKHVTAEMRQYEQLADVYGSKGAINVIICSNNKQLVEQTSYRMNDELYSDNESDDKIVGSSFCWYSGTKKNNISVGELADKIKDNIVSTVVCCAHNQRLQYLYKLVENLNKSDNCKKDINIWIDEADDTINLWSNKDIDVTTFQKVKKITLISATFNSIIEKYGRLRIIPLENTHEKIYSKIGDCIIEQDCTAGTAPNYIIQNYVKRKDKLNVPGMKLFAPGDVTIASHDTIANFLVKEGFAVMILNGNRKCILIPNQDEISIKDHMSEDQPEEISKIMTQIYYDNNLFNYPFAITGQICIGRGLTFQNEKFMFDYGIIPFIDDDAAAYQCACRLAGNLKQHKNYKPPVLITTTVMHKKLISQESVAINLARMVYESQLPDVGEEEILIAGGISDADLQKYRNDKKRTNEQIKLIKLIKTSLQNEEFTSLDDLRNRWKIIDPSSTRKTDFLKDGPYFKCSLGKHSKKQKTSDVRKWLEEKGVSGWGSDLTNYTKPDKIKYSEKLSRIYVGYENEVPTFFLRWIQIPAKADLENPFV